jgi:tetratricopeptide (TPR) repeat protein
LVAEDEGVRRSICDMSLVIFHLFLSNFTHDGVDVMMAQKIVDWNLKRYPEGNEIYFYFFFFLSQILRSRPIIGVFFLLAQGRLYSCRSQADRAIASYQKAMSVQSQYRNLHHISIWEMAVLYLTLWEIEESLKCWRSLHKEATVCLFVIRGGVHT